MKFYNLLIMRRKSIILLSIAIIIIIIIMLLFSWIEERRILASIGGCLFGYDTSSGRLVTVSISTKKTKEVFPQEIQGRNIFYVATFDASTSTSYYLDESLHTIMAYKRGEAAPKPLYSFSGETEREKNAAVYAVNWLLLHPTGDSLYFMEYQQHDTPMFLIELSRETGQRRIISKDWLLSSHCPAWVNQSTLLVLTSNRSLATLDTQSGNLSILLENVGMFALSKTGTAILVEKISGHVGFSALSLITEGYVLYEFPAMRVIKKFSPDIFHGLVNKYYLDDQFYFLGNHHIFFSLSTSGGGWFSKTCLLDLRSLEYRDTLKWLRHMLYVPDCSP